MGEPETDERRARETREAAEHKRAAIIVLGVVAIGILVFVVASVVLMRP